ncbi:unnamed protein product [Diatraea saccharalis]|uniref:Vacuolar protein sorting-associated protein 13 DH-like domain-containing protein n=1 Tax=Diatraea saccharalis TaxID=40085 RepID=A0A9N9N193_9NEOP|nr:unnamed protein product [Diatraea saccharalis]
MESVEPFKAETELLHTGGNRSTSDANIPIVIESESTENIQSKYQQKPKQSPDDIKSETANTITVAEEESGSLDRQTKTTDIRSETPDKSDTEQVTDDNLTIIKDPSLSCFRSSVKIDDNLHVNESQINIHKDNLEIDASHVLQDGTSSSSGAWSSCERMRFVVSSLVLELAGGADEPPLLALHLDRVALLIHQDDKGTNTTLSIAGVQIDNLQYSSGQYDFAVVASTANERTCDDRWPFLWGMLIDIDAFRMRHENARVLLKLRRDNWSIPSGTFSEITEVELSMGPLALYVEDAYVRMYIALDQSPLQLGAFQLKDAVTSVEQLTHALTVHYLSAAILGAGWVVGGLELLGAPGALAARVGGAGGGVRGVAVAAAAALVRSLAACAGSLARNLDLLAGDEEHARRAAAARRRHPQSLAAGILAGVTNFAINILGAVGGLAHHPLVGVAVGEGSSAAALRRSLVGAVAKPLSATADLVAYAGHGLLTQAGWEALPQPRSSWWSERSCKCSVSCAAGWRRDCVRWTFRLAELTALAGYEVTLNRVQLALLITHKKKYKLINI